MHISKRLKQARGKINSSQYYSAAEASKLVKETSCVKFDAAVEIHVRLGIDIKKSEQTVRASVLLPHGTGKTRKVAAFVQADKEKDAKDAGADIVGGKEFIEKIKKDGICDFDVAVATPEIMKDMAVIAKTLGQKGLMPNPKTGTVTSNIKQTIEEIKKGRVDFKNDDTGNVHAAIGRVSFTEQQLTENINAFMEALKKAKPDTIKGTYIKGVTISSTMGPGIKVQL